MEEGGGFVFYESDYLQNSYSAFRDMKEKGEFTDVTIRCKTRLFSAHRVVLASRFPVFHKILKSNDSEISLNEIDPDVLESIINFAYEGKLKVSSDDVHNMLLACGFLQLDQVQKSCWDFLTKNLNAESERSGRIQLLPSDHNIRENFDLFSNTQEFLFLPYRSLKELIKRDDLKVGSEEMVFEAVTKWVKVSLAERRHFLPYLFPEIRMANLTPDYLVKHVATDELVRTSDPCKHIVAEAKNYHLLPRKRSMFLSFSTNPRIYTNIVQDVASHSNTDIAQDIASHSNISIVQDIASHSNTDTVQNIASHSNSDTVQNIASHSTTSRVPIRSITSHSSASRVVNRNILNTRKDLYAVCSTDTLRTTICYCNHGNRKIFKLASCPSGENVEAAVFLKGKIYVFFPNSLKTFCCSARVWTTIGLLPVTVKGSGIVALGKMNMIYVFGGISLTSEVRYFHTQQNEWNQELEEWKMSRCHMGVVASENYVYLTGGITDTSTCCNSFQVYNVVTKEWTEKPSMLHSRMSHGCAKLNKKIYVCGGLNKKFQSLNTAEAYDKTVSQWIFISHMSCRQHSLSLVGWCGKLYAFRGGLQDKNAEHTCHVYNPKKKKWMISNITMALYGEYPAVIKAIVPM